MDIDFVVTWVDMNDPEWQKDFMKYSGNWKNTKNSVSKARFRDYGFLKYWFRGVEKFAPWVRRIHFVTGTSVSNTPLAKVTAEYRLKKVRLFVECVNLLDAREMRRESLDTYSQWWNSFRMRPRSWTAGVRMSF